MNIPVVSKLIGLIEEIFNTSAPIVEKAAVAAAIGTVEEDPKVKAVQDGTIALLAAAQSLKQAINTAQAPPAPAK